MTKKSADQDSWKQHFPTYTFQERDIALQEYSFATKILEAEERLFVNATNIFTVAVAGVGSLALGNLEKLITSLSSTIPSEVTLLTTLIGAAVLSIIALRYFAERQKSIVFASRKVIVLRRMMGLSFGSLQLVLPNWRIEGADEPFSIRMFPGWNSYVAFPFFAVAAASSAVAFFVLSKLLQQEHPAILMVASHTQHGLLLTGSTAAWLSILAVSYRRALFDTHENVLLVLAKKISKAIGIRVVENTEHVIYRAILAKHELHRIGIELSTLKRVLVHIEDKEFYSHNGISLRGIARAILSFAKNRRRSGGSTITQQLARTLFIADQGKVVRRKIVEIILAMWVDRILSKNDQLEIYLASVRFESGVYGIPDAMNHFFGAQDKNPSPAKSFVLIERVSNIRSKYLKEKIEQTIRLAIKKNVLSAKDEDEVREIYQNLIDHEKIMPL